mmetsp:Transcript_31024/g.103315  ORF Transcript_31024/g.103315 Transcript_31024/m.103315 type:complete len:209 (+) Transcript_31024:83-709(+)
MGSRRPPKPHGSCKAKHNHHQPRSNTTPNRAAGLLWEQRIAVPCCVEIHQVGWIAPTLPCEPLLKSRLLRHKAARDARWHPDEGLVPQRAESERGNSCIPLRKPPGAQASSLERTLDLCDEVQPVCSTLLELNPERLAAGALHGIEKLCGAIPSWPTSSVGSKTTLPPGSKPEECRPARRRHALSNRGCGGGTGPARPNTCAPSLCTT